MRPLLGFPRWLSVLVMLTGACAWDAEEDRVQDSTESYEPASTLPAPTSENPPTTVAVPATPENSEQRGAHGLEQSAAGLIGMAAGFTSLDLVDVAASWPQGEGVIASYAFNDGLVQSANDVSAVDRVGRRYFHQLVTKEGAAHLRIINLDDGTPLAVWNVPELAALEYDVLDGSLMAIHSNVGGGVDLLRIAPADGTWIILASHPGEAVEGVSALDVAQRRLHFASILQDGRSALVTVNAEDGRLVAQVPSPTLLGLEYDDGDRRLYGISAESTMMRLLEIDSEAGRITAKAGIPGRGVPGHSAFNAQRGLFFLELESADNCGALVVVNAREGTLQGTLTIRATYGLEYRGPSDQPH